MSGTGITGGVISGLVVDPVDRNCLFESQGLSELMGYQQVEHTGQRGYALPVQLAQIC